MSPKAVLRPLMLASTSRYRAALLERFGLPFNTASPAVDEAEIAGEAPRARALRLSEAKAEAVARPVPRGRGHRRGPGDRRTRPDPAQARQRQPTAASNCALQSGSSAEFFTACTVRCVATALKLSHVDTTTVTLRKLDDAEIERYVEREQPFDCAGGFKAEALGISLFERMESQDPTAIVGLPLIWLAGAPAQRGLPGPLTTAAFLVAQRIDHRGEIRRQRRARGKFHACFRPHEAQLCACRNMRVRPAAFMLSLNSASPYFSSPATG